MPVCPACGQENPEIARFCLACAAPLADVQAPLREERRVVSVVFVDLVGFTARSEQLDPEDVRAILSPYYETVRSELESFGGVVEKFIGDAVMAVFGAPTAHGDDPERAVRAALAVRDAVAQLNTIHPELDLQIRVAVNTGDAVVALDARPGVGEAMIAGDVINTAARLQQTAAVGTIVVGEETYRSTKGAIRYEELAPVVAKGKAEPIEAWQALGPENLSGERTLSQVPLVGRHRELGLLADLWERSTLERRPHLVTILGSPGLGKTRLAFEFIRRVEESGGTAVRGRSLPYREHSAYGAFATQLKSLASIYDSDGIEVAATKLRETVSGLLGEGEAAQVVEHLSILLGLDQGASAADRESLFFSARCFIQAVSRDQPTLLIFEDIHWADPSLLDLIEQLAARLQDLPLLLLTLARPELLDTRPWGGGLLAYTALPLEPLVGEEARELAGILLASASENGREKRAQEIAEAAEGNPLFIEQLAAVMSERSVEGETSLPSTIRGLVAARLDALPAQERSLLLDAAVVGKSFWRGVLERLGDDPAELQPTLAALERRDLIRREPSSSIEGDEEYTFKHVLIREVAYELLPRRERQQRHAEVARFVEESTPEIGEATAALARHWRAAGNHERAVDFFIAAAAEAERGWAKDLAVTLYREALELTPAEDLERTRLLRRKLAVAQQTYLHLTDATLLGRRGGSGG
ncbi:MAG TPA: adenylate/guanylate cyclase domain-containing protein [Gaiellaceae bacterium]